MSKTAMGLVEYAKAQLGRPYWYGTFGQAGAKELYEQKKNQYPKYYTTDYDPSVAGQKVHDCIGLLKGYLWSEDPEDGTPTYNAAQDISANQMKSLCNATPNMETMPEIPGLLVFYDGHMGVYIGGGEVIEARGRKYGVVKTKRSARPWTSWGYCPWIKYEIETEVKTTTVSLPVLKKGAKNDAVKAMQILLIGYGYEMKSDSGKVYGPDGSFGGATDNALRRYQEANDLAVDGSCGPATWAKLLGV